MSTLAGWLDAPIGDRPADEVLKAMTGATPFTREAISALVSKAELVSGLAVRGENRISAANSIWAAIAGRPRWTERDLAIIAEREGHAAALLEVYRHRGLDLFGCLKGSFVIAVVDRQDSRLLLAIDRMGIETASWSEPKAGGVVFGSTTDIVRAHPAVASSVSEQAVFNYLYFGISPSPGTIYREHHKLLPAQYLLYEHGRASTGFYWAMPYSDVTTEPVSELSRALMSTLRDSVGRAIAGRDQSKLGAFLSGGLDSSTVAGLLSEVTRGEAKTFTIGFSQDQYDEVRYAEIAARHFRTQHTNHYLTPDEVAAALPMVARAYDEPFGNSSVVPAYFCAKVAKDQGVSLLLAGDGGDEIFAGNSRYVEQQILDFYGMIPAVLRSRLIEPAVLTRPWLDRISFGRKARNYVRRARVPMPDRLETGNFYRNALLSRVFTDDTLAAINPDEPLANNREVYFRTRSSSMLQRMLHLDLKITLADNDLRKVSGASQIAGVDVAYPYLDDDVVEFSARVAPSLLIRHLSRRWFFRRTVRDFLPKETLAKPKHGFGMPYMEWPRENPKLRAMAVDCVESLKGRSYLRPDFLQTMLEDKRGLYDGLVWDLVMLELWFREHGAPTPQLARTNSVAA